jgi:hypothetical protein
MNLLMISNSVSPSPARRSRLEGKGREGSAVQCVRGDGDGILKRCDVIWGEGFLSFFLLSFYSRLYSPIVASSILIIV